MSDSTIPQDRFSQRRRELVDNPGAIRSASTVNVHDFYGNLETWHIETFRSDGAVEVLLQVNRADGGLRQVLPPQVMAALGRHWTQVTKTARSRGARQAVETKRAKGIPVGNAAALAKGRKRGRK